MSEAEPTLDERVAELEQNLHQVVRLFESLTNSLVKMRRELEDCAHKIRRLTHRLDSGS